MADIGQILGLSLWRLRVPPGKPDLRHPTTSAIAFVTASFSLASNKTLRAAGSMVTFSSGREGY
jgi:hypothetical protein